MIAVADQLAARTWLSPPQVARERNIRTSKVLAWIRSGELVAVNYATRRGGRPRWRVSRAALDSFDAARSCRALTLPTSTPRRSRRDASVTNYF